MAVSSLGKPRTTKLVKKEDMNKNTDLLSEAAVAALKKLFTGRHDGYECTEAVFSQSMMSSKFVLRVRTVGEDKTHKVQHDLITRSREAGLRTLLGFPFRIAVLDPSERLEFRNGFLYKNDSADSVNEEIDDPYAYPLWTCRFVTRSEYDGAKAQLEKIDASLTELRTSGVPDHVHPVLHAAQMRGLESMREELVATVTEYESY